MGSPKTNFQRLTSEEKKAIDLVARQALMTEKACGTQYDAKAENQFLAEAREELTSMLSLQQIKDLTNSSKNKEAVAASNALANICPLPELKPRNFEKLSKEHQDAVRWMAQKQVAIGINCGELAPGFIVRKEANMRELLSSADALTLRGILGAFKNERTRTFLDREVASGTCVLMDIVPGITPQIEPSTKDRIQKII